MQYDFVQISILVCVTVCLYFLCFPYCLYCRTIHRIWIESRKEGVVLGPNYEERV